MKSDHIARGRDSHSLISRNSRPEGLGGRPAPRRYSDSTRKGANKEEQSGEVGSHTHLVIVMCYTIFFSALNATMFNVSIPDISGQFHLTPTQVSWVLTGYVSFFGLGAVIYGKLADIYPVRILITIGLLLFNAGSLIGFFSNWYPMLVAGRLLQASGGAAIPAISMYIATRYFPSGKRGAVMGALASTIATAGAFGPMIGGFIAGFLDWHYLFLVSSLSLLAIPFWHRLLPEEESRKERFDFLGGLLLGAGVFSVLLFLTQFILWTLPAAVLFLGGFVVRINRTENPFVLPELFKSREYRNGLFTLFLSLGTIFGMMFTLPLMLRHVNGLGTLGIGLTIFPGAMTAALVGFVSGRLADRKGSITMVYMGLFLLATGFFSLFLLAGAKPHLITLGIIITYSGFSTLQSTLAQTVSMILPKNQVGVGMGIYNMIFFMSGAIGAAMTSRVIESFANGPVFNPFLTLPAGAYSNVFLLFVGMLICSTLIFFRTFGRGEKFLLAHQDES